VYYKRKLNYIVLYLLLILIMFYLIFPFLWTFVSSLKAESDLYSRVVSVDISNLSFRRYVEIFTGKEKLQASGGAIVGGETLKSFRSGYLNSLIVSTGVVLICLLVGLLSSYAFARYRNKLMRRLFMFVMGTRFVPVLVLTVPFFILIRGIGMMDTKFGLVLVYVSFTLPVIVWIMSGFFEKIPIEIEEAARIDGCSTLGIIFRIILPLSGPAVATSGLVAFIAAWQEFLFALVFTSSLSSKTLPVVMAEFFGRQGMDLGMMSTGATLAAFPIVILALIGQKYIVRGLMMGSVKG